MYSIHKFVIIAVIGIVAGAVFAAAKTQIPIYCDKDAKSQGAQCPYVRCDGILTKENTYRCCCLCNGYKVTPQRPDPGPIGRGIYCDNATHTVCIEHATASSTTKPPPTGAAAGRRRRWL